jgi:hypothetical protein
MEARISSVGKEAEAAPKPAGCATDSTMGRNRSSGLKSSNVSKGRMDMNGTAGERHA